MWEAIQRRLGRPDAALVLAQHYAPADYALLGFATTNSATVGEGLAHAARYLRLWTDDPVLELRDAGLVRLSYRARSPDRPGKRCVTEGALAEIVQAARLATGQQLGPLEIRFGHPGPADTRLYEAYFLAPVHFDQPVTELRFAPAQLAIPLPTANPELGRMLRELANASLARLPAIDSLFDQLRALIAEELQQGVPDMARLARRLAMSPRTLRRRLVDEGTTFSEVLDETRAALARQYVCERRLPLSQVAFLLGFSETSAFNRAFKRWTGAPPLKYRADLGPP